jgi:carotenoid cleavage dioxygenase-like enzyme
MSEFSNFPRSRFYAPQRFEVDLFDCEVAGKIPQELDGVFLRVGSDWAFPPMFKDDSPFNQDGYVSRFRIKNGRCSYKGRWVRTKRFTDNLAVGRQLYGYYRNPFTDDPSVRNPDRPGLRTLANTAAMAHSGRLFALKEDGLPHEIDPVTLDTIGPWDFAGEYRCPTFTAHPKRDPLTGELIAYGYEATGLATDDLWLTVIAPNGTVTRHVRFKVPYVSMIHDIALTDRHIIFPVFPYVTSLDRLRTGKIHWAWDPTAPTYYGIFPRDGEAKDMRWFKGPSRAIVHTINGRSENGKVTLDAPIFDGNPFPFFPSVDGSPWDPGKGRAFVRRVTFDLNSKADTYHEEIVFPEPSVTDLVRIDERYTAQPYRYTFTSYNDESKPFDRAVSGDIKRRISNSYGRFDMQGRKLSSYFAGPTHSLQEVCFIPRKPNAPEGDGFIMGVAHNFAEMRSELIIADAMNMEAGDVARVILPFRSDVQVHGHWFTSADLPSLANENL